MKKGKLLKHFFTFVLSLSVCCLIVPEDVENQWVTLYPADRATVNMQASLQGDFAAFCAYDGYDDVVSLPFSPILSRFVASKVEISKAGIITAAHSENVISLRTLAKDSPCINLAFLKPGHVPIPT